MSRNSFRHGILAITVLTATLFFAGAEALARCRTNADCREGRMCTAGTCRATACTRDLDCSGGGICEQGACRVTVASAVLYPSTRLPAMSVVREESTSDAMWITGAVSLGALYLTRLGLSAGLCNSDCGRAIGYGAIPVLGPVFALVDDSLGKTSGQIAALATFGLLEIAATAALLSGLLRRKPSPIAVSLGDGPRAPRLAIAPTSFGGTGAGVSFTVSGF